MSGKIDLAMVLKAYDYAESHPHKYLRGTTNWCAAIAHSLNEQAAAPVVERQPDAYMTVNPNGMKALFFPSKNIEPSPLDRPLYSSPPAPVAWRTDTPPYDTDLLVELEGGRKHAAAYIEQPVIADKPHGRWFNSDGRELFSVKRWMEIPA